MVSSDWFYLVDFYIINMFFSVALETLQNHRTVSLNFKHDNKDATAHIILDEAHSVTVSQNTSTSDKNRILSSKVSSLLFRFWLLREPGVDLENDLKTPCSH